MERLTQIQAFTYAASSDLNPSSTIFRVAIWLGEDTDYGWIYMNTFATL